MNVITEQFFLIDSFRRTNFSCYPKGLIPRSTVEINMHTKQNTLTNKTSQSTKLDVKKLEALRDN